MSQRDPVADYGCATVILMSVLMWVVLAFGFIWVLQQLGYA